MTKVIDRFVKPRATGTPKPIEFTHYLGGMKVLSTRTDPSEFSLVERIASYEGYDLFLCEKPHEKDDHVHVQWLYFGYWNDGIVREQECSR